MLFRSARRPRRRDEFRLPPAEAVVLQVIVGVAEVHSGKGWRVSREGRDEGVGNKAEWRMVKSFAPFADLARLSFEAASLMA